MDEKKIINSFFLAKDRYAEMGVDTEAAILKMESIPISMHCWQGDDLIGYDGSGELTGGIQTTGNYLGRARTPEELRMDIEEAISLFPGKVKVNLHACHAEKKGKKIDRDAYTIEEFQTWVDWAKEKDMGLDFNPTFFSHSRMDGDFSLASRNDKTRRFWIEHGKRCMEIGQEFGKQLGKICIVNYWMPDGYKDTPADTVTPRELMTKSLDEIFSVPYDENYTKAAIESKLFGMGLESYTVASHEYSLGYAMSRKKIYTLDAGHFHPTEVISAKISAILQFLPNLLLHVSRGVRWDSDHVIVLDDELQRIMDEIVCNGYENRIYIGLDYFDASINRIACWTIGVRNARKALLNAALAPLDLIRSAENNKDYTLRLSLQEERKTLPFGPVWDYYCMTKSTPVGADWTNEIKKYEKEVLCKRND